MDDQKPGPSNASKDDTYTPPALSSVLQEEFNKGAHLITPLSWCPHLEVNFPSTILIKSGPTLGGVRGAVAPLLFEGNKGEKYFREISKKI